MTELSLRNPIAVLMICIALVVFAAVVTPRMSVDTFPELTPPVLVDGHVGAGPRPQRRRKDHHLAHREVRERDARRRPRGEHVAQQPRDRLRVAQVGHRPQRGADAGAAAGRLRDVGGAQVAGRAAAVRPAVRPSNAPVIQVAVSGGGLTGPQLYDYALNNIEPLLEGIPGVASASLNGGRQRQINVVVDPVTGAGARLTSSDIAAAVAQSNALLPSGEFISPDFDANVYTNAVAQRVADIGDAPSSSTDGDAGAASRTSPGWRTAARPRRNRSPSTASDAVYLNVLRVPGGNTLEIVDAVKKAVSG